MTFCVTGGGTGGHLAVAEVLGIAAKKAGHRVVFIGSNKGQDKKWFEKKSPFDAVYFLKTSGVVDQKGFGKLRAMFKIFAAFFHARKLLQKHGVDAVISVGGFSAAAASFAALSKRVPLFIHEQNAVAGRLNTLLRPFAKAFISAYDKDSPLRGYPVNEKFFDLARVRTQLNTLVFLGGSQGAVAINDLALHVSDTLIKKGIRVIHQCGAYDYERVKAAYEALGLDIELYAFIKDMPSVVACADIAVSRAGASTLWELCANGIVPFFIPYPYAAGDHQFYNASFIEKEGMGWCVRQEESPKEKLMGILNEPLEEKSRRLIDICKKDVAQEIIKLIERNY
jgi:UDP-N-acetylglucosamine--N-acetylmuramyl-(pentapeptide) pyrophosphoryl-undecaprenol N-acetylglucosamine transferase